MFRRILLNKLSELYKWKMNRICMKPNTYIKSGKYVYKIIYSRICFTRYTYLISTIYIFHHDNIYIWCVQNICIVKSPLYYFVSSWILVTVSAHYPDFRRQYLVLSIQRRFLKKMNIDHRKNIRRFLSHTKDYFYVSIFP